MVCDYTYDDETGKIRVNCLGCVYGSSIEDFDVCMATTINKLIEVKKATGIVLAETREYEYDFSDVKMLMEIANVVERIAREKIVRIDNITPGKCEKCVPERYMFLQNNVTLIRYDPVKAYKNLVRELRHVKIKMKKMPEECVRCSDYYIKHALEPIINMLSKCTLIKLAEKLGYKDRSFYREVFHPSIRPNFMYTKYISLPPANAETVDKYDVGDTKVEIYKLPSKVRYYYHVIPPEFRLSEDEYSLLDAARRYLGAHKPKEMELAEPEKIRENFYNIGIDLLRDMAERSNLSLSEKRIEKLANILTRYTAGFGILELLLADEHIQDISINAPVGKVPIFVFHSDFEECETNLVPSRDDAESWATRFRLQSGRPLDEANPVLDTEMDVPGARARVAAITRTLSPDGLGFAIRRHRDKPWTFPLFIDNRMMNSLAGGLLWFLIDGARTMLIAGTRSSGKSSLLGSLMLQIMPSLRIITVEDTLELPVVRLMQLGYNIERLKSRSVITRIETEISADEALRTALRLGDSCLIIGEVRSLEARALYEAMRIGALANVVAGTIHGDSPYGVFDRVVNDLGVPKTSFKATDIVVIANRLKSADGLHTFRRMISITEVRKHWKDDPSAEGGFVDLMQYSSKDDTLKPSETLLTGESVILNDIANRVREWKGDWDAVWGNINLRAKILQTIADVARQTKDKSILEAPTVLDSNNQFHIISESVKREIDVLDEKIIYERWFDWFKKTYVKKPGLI
ncbi:MAG: hypothetical protein DRO96_00985 [Candidatus Aenigmatarchaeota archaeon]|nr:MAG: hypothetical protein DRO96_00985 [Candidatus Aenigmarchaeota archaeon]